MHSLAMAFLGFIVCQADQSKQSGVDELITALRSNSIEERWSAVARLVEKGKVAFFPLERLSRDPDPDLAALAKRTIELINLSERLTPEFRKTYPRALSTLVHHPSDFWLPSLRKACVEVTRLRRRDLDPLVEPAWRECNTTNSKQEMCNLIARAQLRSAVPQLEAMLNAVEPPLQALAAETLAKLGASGSTPKLVIAMNRVPRTLEDARSQVAFIRAIGLLGVRESASDLCSLLRTAHPDTKLAIVKALGELGEKSAGSQLLECLDDEQLAAAALSSLRQLEIFGDTAKIRAALKNRDPFIRAEAARVIGQTGDVGSVPTLIEILERDQDPGIRGKVLIAIGQLEAYGQLPVVLRTLKDDSATVRMCGVWASSKLRWAPSEQELRRLLEDPDPSVRISTISLLDGRESQALPNVLIERLRDKVPSVREAAAAVLTKRGRWEGVTSICESKTGLLFLNALRTPEVWKSLREVRYTPPRYGIAAAVLKEIESKVGCPIVVPDPESWKEEAHWARTVSLSRFDSGSSALDVARYIAANGESETESFEVLLDAGTIRLLRKDQAVQFWSQWAEKAAPQK